MSVGPVVTAAVVRAHGRIGRQTAGERRLASVEGGRVGRVLDACVERRQTGVHPGAERLARLRRDLHVGEGVLRRPDALRLAGSETSSGRHREDSHFQQGHGQAFSRHRTSLLGGFTRGIAVGAAR